MHDRVESWGGVEKSVTAELLNQAVVNLKIELN